jgi:hypothetical protein
MILAGGLARPKVIGWGGGIASRAELTSKRPCPGAFVCVREMSLSHYYPPT